LWGPRRGGKPADDPEPVVVVKPAEKPAPGPAGAGAVVPEAPLRVKTLKVRHATRGEKDYEIVGDIGEESFETSFNDLVKIQVDFSAPAYAYLLAFNADGKEQLLWPLAQDKKPDRGARPPRGARIDYPAGKDTWFFLNDEPRGGLQAFAVVASRRPLPSFEEWSKQRGTAAWKRQVGEGVWGADCEGAYRHFKGLALDRGTRGTQAPLPGAPPLRELCRSLHKAGAELVEALAFPVRPRE
jgi:hypothetical protein